MRQARQARSVGTEKSLPARPARRPRPSLSLAPAGTRKSSPTRRAPGHSCTWANRNQLRPLAPAGTRKSRLLPPRRGPGPSGSEQSIIPASMQACTRASTPRSTARAARRSRKQRSCWRRPSARCTRRKTCREPRSWRVPASRSSTRPPRLLASPTSRRRWSRASSLT